jgi:hypothetical protein
MGQKMPKAEVVRVDKFQQMPFVQCPFKYNRRLPVSPEKLKIKQQKSPCGRRGIADWSV